MLNSCLDGGTHWRPNTPNNLFMFTMAELGFNSSHEWSVPPWNSLSPWPLQHPVELSSTNPSHFPWWHLILKFLPSTLSFCTVCWMTWEKTQTWASLPFGALASSSLAGFLAPSWSSQLSHHPAWCLPQWAQQPLCLQAQAFSHLLGFLTTPPLSLATGLTAWAFITALLFSSLPP